MCVLTVIAVIAATLFPLWPAEMRVGVYYLSVAAGCFVASILLLAVGKKHAHPPTIHPLFLPVPLCSTLDKRRTSGRVLLMRLSKVAGCF